jgi:uncharacterized protein (UPF0335 family)
MNTRKSTIQSLGWLLTASAFALGLQTIHAQPADNATVYHAPGKPRVHVEECKRLTKDPAELAKLAKMNFAEAKAKGLEICSKCPAGAAPKPNQSEENKPQEASGEKEMMVYQPVGMKRVHVEECKRLTKDPAELAKHTKMTLAEAKAKGLQTCSKCPGSSTPGKVKPEENEENEEANP